MVYDDYINITSYIQEFLTVSHYHKVYIYIIVFISDLETEHSKSNVNTGSFQNYEIVKMDLTILFYLMYTKERRLTQTVTQTVFNP